MNARQKLHQIHLQEWTVRFADQKASGLTVRQWCEQNNLSFHTYNYWKHLLKEEVVDQTMPDIVPLCELPLICTTKYIDTHNFKLFEEYGVVLLVCIYDYWFTYISTENPVFMRMNQL